MIENECKRCSWKWYQRTPNTPKVCPKCKSPYWNKERRVEKSLAKEVTN